LEDWNENAPASPMAPMRRPSYSAPWAWAQSSMIASPCFAAMALRAFMSQGIPAICTAMIAFVYGVMAASTAAGSRQNVSRSMSANTGTAPTEMTELADAMKVYGGTITSSP